MAQVRIEKIIEHLDYDMKRALEDAVLRVIPNAKVDRSELYNEFRKAVWRKSTTWVQVSDSDVKKVCGECGEDA
jgi:hypothetical protein